MGDGVYAMASGQEYTISEEGQLLEKKVSYLPLPLFKAAPASPPELHPTNSLASTVIPERLAHPGAGPIPSIQDIPPAGHCKLHGTANHGLLIAVRNNIVRASRNYI